MSEVGEQGGPDDPVLGANVHVDGEWWGPAYGRMDPPPEVAAKITNPKAWTTRGKYAAANPPRDGVCPKCGGPAVPLVPRVLQDGKELCEGCIAEVVPFHAPLIEHARDDRIEAEATRLDPDHRRLDEDEL